MIFPGIEAISRWLDDSNTNITNDDAMRILKIAEELGFTGQNPRKGVTHTIDDVCMELANVAVTALCAIEHFKGAGSAKAAMEFKVDYIMHRAGIER